MKMNIPDSMKCDKWKAIDHTLDPIH